MLTGGTRMFAQPIRQRMFIFIVVGMVLAVVLTTTYIVLIFSARDSLAARTAQIHQLSDAANQLILSISLEEERVLDYELSPAQSTLDEFDAAAAASTTNASHLADLVSSDPELAYLVDSATALTVAWRQHWALPRLHLLTSGQSAPVVGPLSLADGERQFSQIESALRQVGGAVELRRAGIAATLDGETSRLVFFVIGASVLYGAFLLAFVFWLERVVSGPLSRLSKTAVSLVKGESVSFRADRPDEIGTLATVLEDLRVDLAGRYAAAVVDAERATTYNKLAERITFASTDQELIGAAIQAIRQLTSVQSGDIQLANPSQDRLIRAGGWGEGDVGVGREVAVARLDRCPGIRRAAAVVLTDLDDAVGLRCPANPVGHGATACVPMVALGYVQGVIHLALPEGSGVETDEIVRVVSSVAERITTALANTRLVQALEDLAMTDPLTGLHNARFFDPFLDQQLAASERDSRPLGLIMLDIDHFKLFNDRYGHPAGDEALRAFSRAVQAVVRTSDVIARYGGEEFIVALPGAGRDEANRVAEKLRAAIEAATIDVGSGNVASITASLGVVSTGTHHVDRAGLVEAADRALYQAKREGRNRVVEALSDKRGLHRASSRRHGTPAGTTAANAGSGAARS